MLKVLMTPGAVQNRFRRAYYIFVIGKDEEQRLVDVRVCNEDEAKQGYLDWCGFLGITPVVVSDATQIELSLTQA